MGSKGMKKAYILRPHPQPTDKVKLIEAIEKAERDSKTLSVYIEEGEPKKRSLSANALQAAWIKEVSDWSGESVIYVRKYIKCEIGIPILLHDCATPAEKEKAAGLKWLLDSCNFWKRTPKQRYGISDYFSVTSDMSTRQHTVFRRQVQEHYMSAGIELVVR